jgi:hypothetical protein
MSGPDIIMAGIDPFCSNSDSATCPTLSKAAAFFGTLFVFLLLFLLTRTKR